MNDKRIFQKLEKINSPKEEIVLKMEYRGKLIHQKSIELPDYASEIIKEEEMNFYYFFKDMANKFEEKINDIHKKKIWNELNKKKDDSSDKGKK